MVRILNKALFLVVWMVVVASLLGFLGWYSRWLDHFASFRVQYFLLSLGVSLWFLGRYLYQKKRRDAFYLLPALFSLGLNGWFVMPWLDYAKANSTTTADFRIYHANILYKNKDYALITNRILSNKPLFISINEATPTFIRHLDSTLGKQYPYGFDVLAKANTRVVIRSQVPVVLDTVVAFSTKGMMRLTTQVRGKPLTIIACHAYNPLWKEDFLIRNQQLKQMAEIIKREKNPTMIIGDLNVTPWSVFYESFIADTRLMNSRQGFGVQPTWPTSFLPLRIPIDHCLTNSLLETTSFRIEKPTKSDHLPLEIGLRFRP
ncbi:hypothetical protein P1X15_12745 [Runella sp. MFBS21]|uniref:endonuclease/exonuclease/phosphatase family protein n=1 Tax=Runella sp. MFBS21 TaxID=3034018 RepID=UPI0023F6F0E7|nr:endonuclease/exonuclease/phosphatase family protein [Runella sp. MFBS21]MDF7818474.1 hypothetical protein [Runella sp. MFBS21]